MKTLPLILYSLLLVETVSAQLAITPDAQLFVAGSVQLTLNNTSFINHGNFSAGTGTVSFTGNGPISVGGTAAIQFNELEVDKTANAFVLLLRPVAITQDLLFSSGFLNLNGFNIDLGTSGVIMNENDSARVIGPNGGELLFQANLNAPVLANPGNLGVFITTAQTLGNVTIHRGHKPQINNGTGVSGIQRYYEISPTNNAALNATLAFKYFDGELNNLAENSLSLFESSDTINWTNLGVDTRNVTANFVEKNNIDSLARFTLFNSNTALPTHFVSINVRCENNSVVINWITAFEQNIQNYSIEKSGDGTSWTSMGQLLPRGTGAGETSYSWIDPDPLPASYYRVAEHDQDGRTHYSGVTRSSCTTTDAITVYPNPASDKLFVNIVAGHYSKAILQLFDTKGARVTQQTETLLRGNNQLSVDVKLLPRGIYHLSASWNDGQLNKTIRILKE